MRVQKNNKGFTLVEVLIAVSILAVLVVPLMANFVTSSKVNQKTKRVMSGTAIAQNIMEGISSYGVEGTIIQLEDAGADEVKLKFVPDNMQPTNWGKCRMDYSTTVDSVTGETTYQPNYTNDRYQDDDNEDIILMKSKLEGIFNDGTDTINGAFSSSYLKPAEDGSIARDDDGNPTFKADDKLHAYMFWMENIKYGNEHYDVILTIDANKHRGSKDTTLDTAKQDVSGYASRESLQNDINDSGNVLSKDRNYNTLKLVEVTNSIGTDAAENDSIQDRYYMEDTNALSYAVDVLLTYCVPGTTREELQANIKREIYIDIRQEPNVINGTKPYTVIGVTYKYSIANAALISSTASISEYYEPEKVIFRSCETKPRNVYFFYLPNYAPTDTVGSDGRDEIYVSNTAGITSGSETYGTELDLYVVRQCATIEESNTTALAQLANSESRYEVRFELEEAIEDDDVENIKTHVFSNIDYDLSDDSYLGEGHMGTYLLNGAASSTEGIDLHGVNGESVYDDDEINKDDYLYDITIQVFRGGFGFDHEMRVAKFTGSSN